MMRQAVNRIVSLVGTHKALAGETRSRAEKPQAKPSARSEVKGRLAGIWGATGGCGVSTLAVNLSSCLARGGQSAILIDANLQQGQIATMLHKTPRFNLFDVVSRNPAIDFHLLEACADRVVAGCLLLSPPADWQTALSRDLGELADALPALRKLAGHIVIDLPGHLDRHLVRIVDQCDELLLVFEPTLSGVAAARQKLDLLSELEFAREKLTLVVNRCSGKSKQVEQRLAECFAGLNMVKLPNDFELCQEALALGLPAVEAAKRAPLLKAVGLLVKQLEAK